MPSVLKAARSEVLLDRLVVEAKDRAKRVLAEAEAEARNVRAAAAAERDDVRRAAAEVGRAEGLAQAGATLAGVAAAREQRLSGLERELAEVALDVAGKLVGRALAVDPALVLELARGALETVRARREVVLRVHPDDAVLLRTSSPALSSLLERAPALVLREDSGLVRGDVIVETEAGRVDARVEAQLALLEQAVVRAEGRP
jgi:flagellar biosynthesis/type III secretory pathway protein FliH